MSDLTAAERIAAEALDFLALSPSDTRAGARLVVAALAATGWLVEPGDRPQNLTGCACHPHCGS